MQASQAVVLHPQLLTNLFAFRYPVFKVFKEVLGLCSLHHIALTRINHRGELVTFSASPALEFNLFKHALWQYDRSYHPSWYSLGLHASWQSLYSKDAFEALYYCKQVKHNLQTGISLARKDQDGYLIYSFASRELCPELASQSDYLYSIGQYCAEALKPLFASCDASFSLPHP